VTRTRWIVLAILAALVVAFFALDLRHYLSLDYLKQQRAAIEAFRDAHFALTAAIFFAVYVLACSFAVAGALTVAAGAIFGQWWCIFIVSFAASIGATLGLLVSRFLLRDAVQKRYGDKLNAINEGVRKDGALYLFTLRLVPVFPFFLINILMGLTPIRPWTFYWVSQIGMLPVGLVFVFAGTQIAQITSLRGILSPGLIGAFVLLGVFPLIAKKTMAYLKGRRRGVQAEQV